MILINDILNKVTEKDIMEYYWGEKLTEYAPKYRNPMRSDRNGTCYFNWYRGHYIFVDRAHGITANFDCFKYVMWNYNCSFYECLFRINEDMKLGLSSVSGKSYNKTRKIKTSRSVQTKIKNVYKVTSRKWNINDEIYWSTFNITLKTLDYFNVKAVKKYQSYSRFTKKFITRYIYDSLDPCYTYLFKENKDVKFKFYQPFSKLNKWKSNTSKLNIFGLSQLPDTGDTVFITSGGKDMMCMYEMGYNAIAPQSESTEIPTNVIEDLKDRFTNVIILYDNDSTGIKMSKEHGKKYNVPYIILPNELNKETLALKDVADFSKEFGLIETKNIIEDVRTSTKSKRKQRKSSTNNSTGIKSAYAERELEITGSWLLS